MTLGVHKEGIMFVARLKIESHIGGMQRVTEVLAHEFIRYGYTVIYLVEASGDNDVVNGVMQFHIPIINSSKRNKVYVQNLIDLHNIKYVVNQCFEYNIFKFLASFPRIKIISCWHNCITSHIENFRGIIDYGVWPDYLKVISRNKIVYMALYSRFRYRFKNNFITAVRYSDKVILLSENYIPEMKLLVPNCSLNNVMSISNPISFEYEKVDYALKENILLYIGRFDDMQKRTDRIIEIWSSLYKQYSEWSFYIVGSGPSRDSLLSLINKNKLERIYVLPAQDPMPLYRRAKILCMTSAFEGFPLVLVEAQMFGVVPFAFNSFAAAREIIDNYKTGFLIKPFEIDDYTKTLASIMRDDQKYMNMSKLCIKSSYRYSRSVIIEKWLKLFASI